MSATLEAPAVASAVAEAPLVREGSYVTTATRSSERGSYTGASVPAASVAGRYVSARLRMPVHGRYTDAER